MKAKLLLTTAALALTVGFGPAVAQNSYGDNNQNDRSAIKKQDPREHSRTESRARQETTGKTQRDESQHVQAGDDKTQAAPKSAGQTSGKGNSANENQDESHQKASAQGERSGNINQAEQGKAKAERSNKNERAAQKPTDQNDRQEAQTPRSTSGQAQQPAPKTNDENARGQTSGEQNRNQAASANGQTHPAERISASLQGSQKSRLTQAVEHVDVQPVSRVDFSVAVGTEVPHTVVLHPVPEAIVDVVPEYRDYDFFLVRDEVVIVEPRTHKIVDVIERHSQARSTSKKERRVHLSVKQRRYLLEHSREHRATTGTARESQIIVGESAPEAAEIDTFPQEVYREVPAVRSYRYIHSGNDVYLVEPGSRRVIERIDEDND